jgi:PAS domain S-box-containing protein
LGITQSYLSSVINGSRTASLNLQSKIAEIFIGSYDHFLAAGRKIKEGKDPRKPKLPETNDSVESLIAKLTYYVMNNKRTQEELNEQAWLLGKTIEFIPSAVIVTDAGNNVIKRNRAFKEIIGFPDDVYESANLQKLIAYAKEIFKDEELFLSEAEGVLSSQKEVAFTMKTKDDRTLEITSMPLFRGEQFSGRVVYVEDITSTKSKK